MQHDEIAALVRDHQQELLRAARERALSRGFRAQQERLEPRPLSLRLLGRLLGPR